MSNFPVPVNYHPTDRYGNQQSGINILPYHSLDWIEVANKYGMKIPTIVDRSMGTSECRACNAKYAGTQSHCTAIVEKHRPRGRWHDEHGYSFNAERNFKEECRGVLGWNLQEQFSLQERLFSLINDLRYLDSPTNLKFDEFEKLFPVGVVGPLKLRLLTSNVDSMLMQQERILDGMRQIAEKMNAAGSALHF